MSRKASTDTGEDQDPAAATNAGETDLHGFWDRANLDGDVNDDAFAAVIEGDAADERDSLVSMGTTQIDADERTALADWAEAKACRTCQHKIREHHDPALLKHDECRIALRVGRLLRRYT